MKIHLQDIPMMHLHILIGLQDLPQDGNQALINFDRGDGSCRLCQLLG